MPTQTKVVDTIMEDMAVNIFSNYLYMQVSTSTLSISDSATSLNSSTQVGINSSLYNKLYDTTVTGSFRDGRTLVYKFKLETGEPNTQPLNIGSVALMKVATNSAGMGVGGVLPVSATKDNQSRWVLRAELNVKRAGE